MMQSIETIQVARERQMEHRQAVAEQQTRCELSGPSMMSKTGFAASILILVLILLSTGCTLESVLAADNGPKDESSAVPENPFSINSDHLAATWRIYDKGYPNFLRLNSDHSFQRSHSSKMDEVVDFGEWQFDGESLTLISDEAVANCNGQSDGQYRLRNKPYDGIFFVQIEENCEGRLGFGWAEDYAPIQMTGKLCRVDSVAFCDSFVGYDAEDVVQPNAARSEDKVVAPSSDSADYAKSQPQTDDAAPTDDEDEDAVVTEGTQSNGDNFFLQD